MTKPNQECREVSRQPHELCEAELETVTGGGMMELMGQMMTNLANMRHEALKSIAQNLRG